MPLHGPLLNNNNLTWSAENQWCCTKPFNTAFFPDEKDAWDIEFDIQIWRTKIYKYVASYVAS